LPACPTVPYRIRDCIWVGHHLLTTARLSAPDVFLGIALEAIPHHGDGNKGLATFDFGLRLPTRTLLLLSERSRSVYSCPTHNCERSTDPLLDGFGLHTSCSESLDTFLYFSFNGTINTHCLYATTRLNKPRLHVTFWPNEPHLHATLLPNNPHASTEHSPCLPAKQTPFTRHPMAEQPQSLHGATTPFIRWPNAPVYTPPSGRTIPKLLWSNHPVYTPPPGQTNPFICHLPAE
jgi:hypothetical protein